MQIVFEAQNLPESGVVELDLHRTFEIKVTAEAARRQVNHWLSWQVSMLIVADPPLLVVGERIVWRVPAWIGFPSVGRAGDVGSVDVDVQTGELYDLEQAKAAIETCASAIAKRLPPFRPKKVGKEFIPAHVPPAPILYSE